jgi:hypothetical protein
MLERHLMHELEISSVERATIIAHDSEGQEYRVSVDEASLARLKRNQTNESASKVSPREIQALLRSGLSSAEVSAMTGATDEQIDRYATPVLAEREYVITTAQTLPAFGHVETSDDPSLFGEIVAERLEIVDARDREWTAWKSEEGRWFLKLTFSVAGVERDARWIFDGKRHSVTPQNDEAKLLSTAGSFNPPASPTLRAVPDRVEVSESSIVELETPGESTPLLVDVETESVVSSVDTIDLLEALRRRRSQSDDAPAWLRDDVAARTAPVDELFEDSLDIPFDHASTEDFSSQPVFPLSSTGGHKRNRPTMPKWNEIVSETKSDDDLI